MEDAITPPKWRPVALVPLKTKALEPAGFLPALTLKVVDDVVPAAM